MCQTKAQGGKRCEYAETINVVRRRATRKHADERYNRYAMIEKDVAAWKAEHSELVTQHLPTTQPFQTKPSNTIIPDDIQAYLTPVHEPITGLPAEQQAQHTTDLFQRRRAWLDTLEQDHKDAVRQYTQHFYEVLNRALRKNGLTALLKREPHYKNQNLQARIKKITHDLDDAIRQAPQTEEPQKLYRYYKVPDGVNAKDYVKKYFTPGQDFKDPGYMSTTTDPEYIMAIAHQNDHSPKNNRYIVMEIITKQGVSLQSSNDSRSGDIQSLEREILLPRNMKLRIAAVKATKKFQFASTRQNLFGQERHSRWIPENSFYQQGQHMNLTFVQLVDEKLTVKA
jgi:hypothetical protein